MGFFRRKKKAGESEAEVDPTQPTKLTKLAESKRKSWRNKRKSKAKENALKSGAVVETAKTADADDISTDDPLSNSSVGGTSGRRKKVPAPIRGQVRVRSRDFASPLNTIAETEPGSAVLSTPDEESPVEKRVVLTDLNVVGYQDSGEHELVYGQFLSEPVVLSPTLSESSADSIFRKQPFASRYQSPDEEPFDFEQEYFGDEDPYIRDIIRTESEEQEERERQKLEESVEDSGSLYSANRSPPRLALPPESPVIAPRTAAVAGAAATVSQEPKSTNVARQLFEVFNCASDYTDTPTPFGDSYTFYDRVCGAGDYEKDKKRPFFNEEFALAFIRQMSRDGVPLLQYVAPNDDEYVVEDWTGRTVTMCVRLGNCDGDEVLQPRLEWESSGGGSPERRQNIPLRQSVNIIDIAAIADSLGDEHRDDVVEQTEAEMCFFSVTNNDGDVYLFEASSYDLKERIVNGIKNVVARLVFHTIAGDDAVASELYSSDEFGQTIGDLPALHTPRTSMHRVTHAFLDAE